MFKSSLGKEMEAFLELRSQLFSAKSIDNTRRDLKNLDKYLYSCGFQGKTLTETVLNEWIATLPGKSKTVKEKVGSVRVFVKYLNALGYEAFLPQAPRVKSDYIPYIYSDDEIRLIFHYADNLKEKNPNDNRKSFQLIIPMALRILYSCGTRLGETMALQRKDVDLKNGTLFFRKTKFSKERLVPIHPLLRDILERYCMVLGILHVPDAYLFPGRKPNTHYCTRQMDSRLAEILKMANIDQRKKERYERGACIHCFRHLFVLKSTQQLEDNGHSVHLDDLLLPTYLGHETLLDTDKYMRFSGTQVSETIESFESFSAGLIPNVEVPDEEE